MLLWTLYKLGRSVPFCPFAKCAVIFGHLFLVIKVSVLYWPLLSSILVRVPGRGPRHRVVVCYIIQPNKHRNSLPSFLSVSSTVALVVPSYRNLIPNAAYSASKRKALSTTTHFKDDDVYNAWWKTQRVADNTISQIDIGGRPNNIEWSFMVPLRYVRNWLQTGGIFPRSCIVVVMMVC